MSEYYTESELAGVHCIGCGHPWGEKFGESEWAPVGHKMYQCPRCCMPLSTRKPTSDILAEKDAEIAKLKEQAKGCCGNLLSIYGPEVIAEAERQTKIEVLAKVLKAFSVKYQPFRGIRDCIRYIEDEIKQLEADQ